MIEALQDLLMLMLYLLDKLFRFCYAVLVWFFGQPERPGCLNLNTVSVEELIEATGIPRSQARRLIVYRSKIGGYQSFDDLNDVDGLWQLVADHLREDEGIVL